MTCISVQVDVLGIWRFVSIPIQNSTVDKFKDQLEIEFQNIYKVAIPLKITTLMKGEAALPNEELVENVLSANDIAFVIPADDWKDQVRTNAYKIVGL